MDPEINKSLINACRHQNITLASQFISHGANPNAISDITDETPLYIASKSGNTELIKVLVTAGAFIDVDSIAVTIEKNNLACFNQLLDLLQDDTVLNNATQDEYCLVHQCAKYGNVQIYFKLVEFGVDTKVLGFNGSNLVHVACENHKTSFLKEILSSIDLGMLNEQDYSGNTPVHIVVMNDFHDILQILLEFNPDLQIRNCDGYTAFELGVKMSSMNSVDMLMEFDHKLREQYAEIKVTTPKYPTDEEMDYDSGIFEYVPSEKTLSKKADFLTKSARNTLTGGLSGGRRRSKISVTKVSNSQDNSDYVYNVETVEEPDKVVEAATEEQWSYYSTYEYPTPPPLFALNIGPTENDYEYYEKSESSDGHIFYVKMSDNSILLEDPRISFEYFFAPVSAYGKPKSNNNNSNSNSSIPSTPLAESNELALREQISRLANDNETLQQKMNEIKYQINEYDEKIRSKELEYENRENALKISYEEKIQSLNDKIDKLKHSNTPSNITADTKVKELTEKIEELKKDNHSLTDEMKKLQSKCEKYDNEHNKDVEKIKELIHSNESSLSNTQNVPTNPEIEDKMKKQEEKIKSLEKLLSTYKEEIKKRSEKVKKYEAQLIQFQKKVKHDISIIRDLESKIKQYEPDFVSPIGPTLESSARSTTSTVTPPTVPKVVKTDSQSPPLPPQQTSHLNNNNNHSSGIKKASPNTSMSPSPTTTTRTSPNKLAKSPQVINSKSLNKSGVSNQSKTAGSIPQQLPKKRQPIKSCAIPSSFKITEEDKKQPHSKETGDSPEKIKHSISKPVALPVDKSKAKQSPEKTPKQK